MDYWNLDEKQEFIASLEGNWYQALFYVALKTGLRMGELRGLRWSDVNARIGRFAISQQLPAKSIHAKDLKTLKTAKSRRSIEITDLMKAALDKHRARLDAAGLERTPWVFPTAEGIPVQPKTLTREFGYAMHRARVRRIRFHDMRHTFATLALEDGEDVKVISEMLGHASVLTTIETYQHITPSMQRRSRERSDRRY